MRNVSGSCTESSTGHSSVDGNLGPILVRMAQNRVQTSPPVLLSVTNGASHHNELLPFEALRLTGRLRSGATQRPSLARADKTWAGSLLSEQLFAGHVLAILLQIAACMQSTCRLRTRHLLYWLDWLTQEANTHDAAGFPNQKGYGPCLSNSYDCIPNVRA